MSIVNHFFDDLEGTWTNENNPTHGYNFIIQPMPKKFKVPVSDGFTPPAGSRVDENGWVTVANANRGSDFMGRIETIKETIEFEKVGTAKNIGEAGEVGVWQSFKYEISIKAVKRVFVMFNEKGTETFGQFINTDKGTFTIGTFVDTVDPKELIHHEMGHFMLRVGRDGNIESTEHFGNETHKSQPVGQVIRQATIPRGNSFLTHGKLRKEGVPARNPSSGNKIFYKINNKWFHELKQSDIDGLTLNSLSIILGTKWSGNIENGDAEKLSLLYDLTPKILYFKKAMADIKWAPASLRTALTNKMQSIIDAAAISTELLQKTMDDFNAILGHGDTLTGTDLLKNANAPLNLDLTQANAGIPNFLHRVDRSATWEFKFRDDAHGESGSKDDAHMASGQRVKIPVKIGNLISDFWINGPNNATKLQYAQKVNLTFGGIEFPHVSVNTLTKKPS